MRRISQEQLKEADGQEGRESLVAVEGKVYDVSASKRWKGGRHMNSHAAGADLTAALASAPHGPEMLERLPLVGELQSEPEPAGHAAARGLLGWVLAQHPHPVSVHFPIALLVSAALFTLLGLLLDEPSLHRAALYNLGLGTLAVPAAMAAGLLSQRFNYAGVWSPLLRAKLAVSIPLFVLSTCTLYIRVLVIGPDATEGTLYWVYVASVLTLAPMVVSLGYLGGRITFPR